MPAADYDNCVGGPAKVLYASEEVGHTAGGVSVKVSPKHRMRNVDQFGSGECAVLHTGDEVRVTVAWAEWTAAVIGYVYQPGNNQTAAASNKYMGLGKSAGYKYASALLDVVPRLSGDAAKLVRIFKAVPVGNIDLKFNEKDDRIFETEFAGLIDEDRIDGQMIGVIMVGGTPPT